MSRRIALPLLALLLFSSAPVVLFADAASLVSENCAGCHKIEAPGERELSARLQRIAPPLYYAGNKYRESWLVEWLQEPERIHPAGYLPAADVKSGEDGDMPDEQALEEHLALSEQEANEVASYLMSLTEKQHLLEADNYTPGTVAMRMGMMDFRRFKGCDACHQDSPTSGGLSGPEVHSAWQRLQPAYLSSFIQNPVAWDPLTTMPVLSMNEDAVHRLVHYLRMIGESE